MKPEYAQPLVSVCIQTYQHASYIRECLQSVVCQETDFPFEIVLGEDDSSDGTREICQEYSKKYPGLVRLFLRSEKEKIYINGERTGRFNFMENLKAARGKYIATLDGDDYWLDLHKLQKQYDFMERHPGCTLCFHDTFQRVASGALTGDHGSQSEERVFSIEEAMSVVGKLTLHTSNVFFRQECVQNMPDWFYEVPFLDVALFTYVGSFGNVGYVPETKSVYRVHREGMWLSRKEPLNYMKQWNLFTIMCRHFTGETRKVLLERRRMIGLQLIRFLKRHLWLRRNWFRQELGRNEFPGDLELLAFLEKPPGLTEYFFNIGSYSKNVFRKFIKA